MKFIVASTNPVKIKAVSSAINSHFPLAQIKGLEVDSGVPAQPMSDGETKLGSTNRAKAVKELAIKKNLVKTGEQALFIGIEGGVFLPEFAENKEELWSTVWATVLDQNDHQYLSNGARFPLPNFLSKLLLLGQEMGPALGNYVNDPDLRKKEGMIGYITHHFTNRSDEYQSIVKIAIGLWYGQQHSQDNS